MASLLTNQTFKKKMNFVKMSNDEERISFSITLNANHNVNMCIIQEVERTINSLMLSDYIDEEKFKEREEQYKQQLRNEKEQQKKENKKRVLGE